MADSNYDLNAPVQQAQTNTSTLMGMFDKNKQEGQDFLKGYGSFIGSMPTTSSLADTIGSSMGIDKLRANAQGLNNTLFNIPQTYTQGTMGSNTNANQLARLIGQKQYEIAPSAQLATQNLQTAEGNLNTRLGYATADQQRSMLPWEKGYDLMTQQQAQRTSGYSTAMRGELDAIIAKMNSGITLSEDEKNRAQQLAIAEKGYQNALAMNQSNFANQKELNSQQNSAAINLAQVNAGLNPPYMQVQPGNQVINPRTGQPVYSGSYGGGVNKYLGGTNTGATAGFVPDNSTG